MPLKINILLLIILISLWPGPVRADLKEYKQKMDETVQTSIMLQENCEYYRKIRDNEIKISPENSFEEVTVTTHAAASCIAYIEGYLDVLKILTATKTNNIACIPFAALYNTDLMVRIYLDWTYDNMRLIGEEKSFTLARALNNKYPCSAQQ